MPGIWSGASGAGCQASGATRYLEQQVPPVGYQASEAVPGIQGAGALGRSCLPEDLTECPGEHTWYQRYG